MIVIHFDLLTVLLMAVTLIGIGVVLYNRGYRHGIQEMDGIYKPLRDAVEKEINE